jgi:hypothetical protein
MNENNRKPFSLYHIMYFVTPPCPKIISLRLEWQSLHPYPQRKEDKKKKNFILKQAQLDGKKIKLTLSRLCG